MEKEIKNLVMTSKQLREDVLKAVHCAKTGHIGASFSIIDILVVLYFEIMSIDPDHPEHKDRDRFVLSKGHGCPALYATLARKGYFPTKVLNTLRQIDSPLQGHPDMNKTVGVDMTTGSLGQGVSAAVGMAIGAKLIDSAFHVFLITGDGELDEGQVWEAFMAASKFKLDNLTLIVDYNGYQVNGKISEIMPLEPLGLKFKAFGWEVRWIDGHNHKELLENLSYAKSRQSLKPMVLIAKTVKGKGVSFMENNDKWHTGVPNQEELQKALNLLRKREVT